MEYCEMTTFNKVEFKNKEKTGKYSHDNQYIIIDFNARMKNPDTGEWIDAVIYSENMLRGSTIYVRSKTDFIDKFKKC